MRFVGCILVIMPFFVFGQELTIAKSGDKTFDQYLQDFSEVDGSDIHALDFLKFVERLDEKGEQKNTLKFCRTLFQKTRQEFLRNYTQYASFGETLSKGKYNCLTGTALYAMLLEHFNIQYSIIETNYHIFLLADTNEGRVLFEATDPLHGFVTNRDEIEKRIQRYKQNVIQATPAGNNKKYYEYNVSLYQQVSLDQMSGLLHYNLSIEAYNQQDFQEAIDHLDKALDLYSSPRITEFSAILLLSVLESKLDESVKESYLKRIQAIRKKQLPIMASRGQSY
jgi:tetratricopeptide (TPR) repeat protein